MRLVRTAVLAFALSSPMAAQAQSCGGFSDVFPTDFFCTSVEWIKNRGVTLGCAAGLYCPNDFVPRSQMSAFMERLGKSLTPTVLSVSEAADGTYDPPARYCITAPLTITGYPRQATANATLYNFASPVNKVVFGQPAYSTDGGTTWLAFPGPVNGQSSGGQTYATMPMNGGPLDLAVGTTYRFAVALFTLQAGASTQGTCHLMVRIDNRNPTTSPLDAE
jgi:hypothetical protein